VCVLGVIDDAQPPGVLGFVLPPPAGQVRVDPEGDARKTSRRCTVWPATNSP
jgi:hypothetical protein